MSSFLGIPPRVLDKNSAAYQISSERRAVIRAHFDPVMNPDPNKSFQEIYDGYLNNDPSVHPGFRCNFLATGTSELTANQKAYLNETYDFTDMTWDEYIRYLGDLTVFNVISWDAFFHLTLRQEGNEMRNDSLFAGSSGAPAYFEGFREYKFQGVIDLTDYLEATMKHVWASDEQARLADPAFAEHPAYSWYRKVSEITKALTHIDRAI